MPVSKISSTTSTLVPRHLPGIVINIIKCCEMPNSNSIHLIKYVPFLSPLYFLMKNLAKTKHVTKLLYVWGVSRCNTASFYRKNRPLKRAATDQMGVQEKNYYSDVVVEMPPHSSNDLFQVRISHLSLLCGLLERSFD